MTAQNFLLIEQIILAGPIDGKEYTKVSSGNGSCLFTTAGYFLELNFSPYGMQIALYASADFTQIGIVKMPGEFSVEELKTFITGLYPAE